MRLRSSNTGVPGALSMTWMDVRDEAEAEEVRQRARAIAAEMARGSGFIGWVGIGIAERLYTLTLWDDPEAIRQLSRNTLHQAAVRKVFESDFGTAFHTGVWVPDHLNPRWQRCPRCGTIIDLDRPDASCPCGEPVPARRSYL